MTAWITDTPGNERFPLLTRANASEVAPDPLTPVGWSVLWLRGCVPGVVDGLIERGLFRESERAELQPTFSCIGGYLYLNLSIIRVQGARTPGATVEDVERHLIGDHSGAAPYIARDGDEDPELESLVAQRMGELLTADRIPGVAEDRDAATRARRQRPDLSAIDHGALVDRARECAELMRHCFRTYTLITAGSSMGAGLLAKSLTALGGDAPSPVALLGSIGEVESTASVHALWELSRTARRSAAVSSLLESGSEQAVAALTSGEVLDSSVAKFADELSRFGDEFGYKGPAEWDPGADSWGTDPALVIRMVDQLRRQDDTKAPMTRAADSRQAAELARGRAERALAAIPDALGEYRMGLEASRRYLAARESVKLSMSMLVHEIRLALVELARRHGMELHLIAMLTDDELEAFAAEASTLVDEMSSRRTRFDDLALLEPPFFVDGVAPPLESWPRRAQESTQSNRDLDNPITGVPVSAGVARGRVRIVSDPSNVDLEFGDVLVARATDPSWMPLLTMAAAVVVETGSLISHAVIVSRELGLPCVVGIDGVLGLLRDGATVEVDGTAGTITIVDASS